MNNHGIVHESSCAYTPQENGVADRKNWHILEIRGLRGVDYEEIFSPIAKIVSVRISIDLVAMRRWPLHQLDVKNAFLNGILEVEVYMTQPPGFIVQEETSTVCCLKRSLYGLKQSPQAWFGRLSQALG
ncbi:Retrovirus-related Pol polyprotein from transposon RE1-like protein [Drosera capensis]